MSTVEVTTDELNLLIERMQSWISELEAEIAHTDRAPFRAGLKEDHVKAQALLDKLLEFSQISHAV